MQPNEEQQEQTAQPQSEMVRRAFIKFNHEEVEALLSLLNDMDDLNEIEQSARSKLKRIYARQIISHERANDPSR